MGRKQSGRLLYLFPDDSGRYPDMNFDSILELTVGINRYSEGKGDKMVGWGKPCENKPFRVEDRWTMSEPSSRNFWLRAAIIRPKKECE